MIVLDVEQGSRKWHRARLSIVTATGFSSIVTPAGRPSSAREKYMGRLLAEWVLGEAYEQQVETFWTSRGKRLEPKARKFYEYERDTSVTEVGLAYRDESRLVAASPDALSGDAGLLEIKCPDPAKHLCHLSMAEIPREYVTQLQAQLWVTGRDWVDWMSWSPDLPPVIRRATPDEKLHKAFEQHVLGFVAEMLERRQKLTDDYGLAPMEYDAEADWGGL